MTLLFTIAKNEDKKIIKNILLSGVICIICVIVDLLQIKIVGVLLGMRQVRMGGISNIPYNFIFILQTLPNILIKTTNIFPDYLFIVLLLINTVFLNIVSRNRIKQINLSISLIVIFSIGTAFAPHIFSLAGYNGARMMFTIGALIGNIFSYIYIKTDILDNKKVRPIIIILILSYFYINTINYVYLINKHKEVEILNRSECYQINEYMKEYEENNKVELKYISVYYDNNPTYYYEVLKNESALSIRPLSVEWADNGSINYYTNRKLIEVPMEEEIYNTYFKNKDWDYLSEEQFVFIKDTMYYCIY